MADFSTYLSDICHNAVTAQGLFIGRKLGLFTAINQLPQPFTAKQLATASKCKTFFVKQWLMMMAASKVVELHPDLCFSLSEEYIHQLTSPLFTPFHQIIGFASHANDLISCMRQDGPKNFPCQLYQLMVSEEHGRALPHVFNIVAQQVPGLLQLLDEGCHVLDVGCGEGILVQHLGQQYPKSSFIGIDPWLDSSKQMDNVSLQPHSASQLPPEWNSTFHYVIAMNSLHHVEDGAKAAGEMHRVLKTGGHLSVVEIHQEEQIEEDIQRSGASNSYLTNMMFKAAHSEGETHETSAQSDKGEGQSTSEGRGQDEGQGQCEPDGHGRDEGEGEESDDEQAVLFQTTTQLQKTITGGGFSSVQLLPLPRTEFLDQIHLLAHKTGD